MTTQVRSAYAWSLIQLRLDAMCPLWDKIERYTYGQDGSEPVKIAVHQEDVSCLSAALATFPQAWQTALQREAEALT